MNSHEMSWKARLNHYAQEHGIAPQAVLQNVMFERFLRRLSDSAYRDFFVLKGGVLVAAIVGLEYRSTMDIDTTLRHFPLNEDRISRAIVEICAIDEEDNTDFDLLKIESIRREDEYGGLRLSMQAKSGGIVVPFKIDISTGDVITPQPVEMDFPSFFGELPPIPIWCYNIETILAEKIETILRRGILSTRPRDFYDVYILSHTRSINFTLLQQAIQATVQHRGYLITIDQWREILKALSTSEVQQEYWRNYRRKFPYAKSIEYADLMSCLEKLLNTIA